MTLKTLSYRILFFLFVIALMPACTTKTLKNEQLWYSLTVPKTWTTENGIIKTDKGETISIVRLHNDARISTLIQTTMENIRRNMVGFVTESESRNQINGHCAWKLVGAHRPEKNGPEYVIIRVIIDTNQKATKDCEENYEPGVYKYVIDIKTPSESYNKRKKILNKVIKSFSFKLPEY